MKFGAGKVFFADDGLPLLRAWNDLLFAVF
jgi:hypothetical protein